MKYKIPIYFDAFAEITVEADSTNAAFDAAREKIKYMGLNNIIKTANIGYYHPRVRYNQPAFDENGNEVNYKDFGYMD